MRKKENSKRTSIGDKKQHQGNKLVKGRARNHSFDKRDKEDEPKREGGPAQRTFKPRSKPASSRSTREDNTEQRTFNPRSKPASSRSTREDNTEQRSFNPRSKTTSSRSTREGDTEQRTYNPRSKTTSSRPMREDDASQRTSKPRSKPTASKPRKSDDVMRLNRFLANSGVCSRREADNYISSGCVTVNGKIVSELGSKVSVYDEVKFNGQSLNPQKKVYLLLNKPKGYVTTTDDPQERKTVMELVSKYCTERIYPVGRLDINTSGVLLFTNDGELSKKLTHPSHNMKKIYQVYLDKPLTKNHLLEIARGIELEDGKIAADAINYTDENDKHEIGIEIHSGRNRIVRRIFAHLGYDVKKLDRVYFAGLTKKNLSRGRTRFLTQAEINLLKML